MKALAISDIVNVARTTLLFVLCSMITGTEVRAENPQSTVLPQAKLKPFLQTYCVRCHGPEKQNGQVRFDRIAWEITNNDSAQRWQDVLKPGVEFDDSVNAHGNMDYPTVFVELSRKNTGREILVPATSA